MDHIDRFNDLQQQGFMQPRRTRKAKPEVPTIACDDCLNWHAKGKHTADAATRKANRLTRRLATSDKLSIVRNHQRAARHLRRKFCATGSSDAMYRERVQYANECAFCNPPPLRVGEDKATVAERWAVRWLARFDLFTA